jgi:TetR/AcrR family transcriptional repressor of nem operon
MRYPAEQKAETHERILAAAARSFRERGAASNGIGAVMKELGLTKGGFYRHFESKDDLYVEAVARALADRGDRMVRVGKAAPKGRELRAIIEDYLSLEHLEAPGTGCAIAALAPELSRQPIAVRRRINQALMTYRDRLLPFIPGRSEDEKRVRFLVLFGGMAGVLSVVRALADPQARERMLMGARSFYLATFAAENPD